jgi:hypothetical protein
MQTRTFINFVNATKRIFREGNFYAGDLNTSQEIMSKKVEDLARLCITPGIYSIINPLTNTGAFSVQMLDNTTLQIEPGLVVFKDGTIFELTSPAQFQFDLVADDFATDYVVCVMKVPNQVLETRFNMATEGLESVETGNAYEVRFLMQDEFKMLNQDELENYILLAKIFKLPDPNAKYIINQEGNLSRPWFTWSDFQHRALKGSGTATNSNPHGLSFLDLDTLPGMSYWKINGLTGIVSVVDTNESNYGDVVEITIPPLSLSNNLGNSSAASFKLPKGAAHVLSVKEDTIYHNFKYSKNTRTVTLYPLVPVTQTLTVKALLIHAGTVNPQVGSDTVLEIEPALQDELIIFNNSVLSNFAGGQINCQTLAGAANIYDFYVDTYGAIVTNPIPVLQTSIIQIGGGLTDPISLPENAPLYIALGNFIVPVNFSLTLKLVGTISGQAVQESLVITNGGTTINFNIPANSDLRSTNNTKLPGQWARTIKSFSTITQVVVESASANLPVDTTIYMIQNLGSITGLMPIAKVSVSSRGQIVSIMDTRNQKIGYGKTSDFLFYEDFYNPINFNPDNSTMKKEFGLTEASYESRPIHFLKGAYLLELGIDSFDASNPPQVAVASINEAPQVLELLPFDDANEKLFYRAAFSAPTYRKVLVSCPSGSGNNLNYLGIDLLTDTPSLDFGGTVVSGALTLGPESVIASVHLDNLNFNLTAGGGTPPYSYNLLNSTIQSANLNYDPSNTIGAVVTISNIPATGVNGTVTARVVDHLNQSVTISIPVSVPASQETPTSGGRIYPETFTASSYSDSVTFDLSASGGAQPYIFSLMSGGTLPNAVIYDNKVTVSQIPLTGIIGTLNVKVTDFNGLSDIYLVTVTVPAANYSISVAPLNWVAPAYGATLTFAINPIGGVPPYTVTLLTTGTARPYASSFNNLITLNNVPNTGYTGTLGVRAVDAHGIMAEATVTVTVPSLQQMVLSPRGGSLTSSYNISSSSPHVLSGIGPVDILGGTPPYIIQAILDSDTTLSNPVISYDYSLKPREFSFSGTTTGTGTKSVKIRCTSVENYQTEQILNVVVTDTANPLDIRVNGGPVSGGAIVSTAGLVSPISFQASIGVLGGFPASTNPAYTIEIASTNVLNSSISYQSGGVWLVQGQVDRGLGNDQLAQSYQMVLRVTDSRNQSSDFTVLVHS